MLRYRKRQANRGFNASKLPLNSIAHDAHPVALNEREKELGFFYRWRRLDLPYGQSYRLDCLKVKGAATYKNVPPLCARLIESGLATMRELKTDLSLEEAYQLDEILTLRNYHQWLGAYLQRQKE